MKTHGRFEWAEPEPSKKIYAGDTEADVYRQLNPDGEMPEDVTGWFLQQQEAGTGSWKWYDSLIGEKWRFNPNLNDLVRRVGAGRGRRKKVDKLRDSAKKNLDVSHERRRINKEQASEIARKGQAALQAKQSRQDVLDRMAKMRATRAARQAAMTPEQRAEIGRRISEAKKAGFARRKAENEDGQQ